MEAICANCRWWVDALHDDTLSALGFTGICDLSCGDVKFRTHRKMTAEADAGAYAWMRIKWDYGCNQHEPLQVKEA